MKASNPLIKKCIFKGSKNNNYFVWMVLEFSVWTFSSKILWNFSQKRADAISGNIIWKHIYVPDHMSRIWMKQVQVGWCILWCSSKNINHLYPVQVQIIIPEYIITLHCSCSYSSTQYTENDWENTFLHSKNSTVVVIKWFISVEYGFQHDNSPYQADKC